MKAETVQSPLPQGQRGEEDAKKRAAFLEGFSLQAGMHVHGRNGDGLEQLLHQVLEATALGRAPHACWRRDSAAPAGKEDGRTATVRAQGGQLTRIALSLNAVRHFVDLLRRMPGLQLLQSASRRMTGIAVGEEGVADLRIPLRLHWEVHALDPGYSVCGFERQIWFHDAPHGFVTFQVDPRVDPSLTSPDSERIHGMLMSTSDGGKTWSVARADISTSFADFRPTASGWFANGFLFSLDDGLLLSLGDNGALVRSTDSGQSWAAASLNWDTPGPGGVGTTRYARAGSKLYASITTGGVQGSCERSQLVVSEDEGLAWSQRFDVCNPNYYAPNGCGTSGVPLGFAGIDMACFDLHPEDCITMGYEHDNYTSKVMVTTTVSRPTRPSRPSAAGAPTAKCSGCPGPTRPWWWGARAVRGPELSSSRPPTAA